MFMPMYKNTYIRCFPDNLVIGDIVRFEEKVTGDRGTPHFQWRSIEAKIVGEFYTRARKQYFEFEIIHSKGYEPIKS